MFKSVKSNKVSEHIVEQIRKAIFDGTLKPGDKLPPRKGVSGGAFVTEVER